MLSFAMFKRLLLEREGADKVFLWSLQVVVSGMLDDEDGTATVFFVTTGVEEIERVEGCVSTNDVVARVVDGASDDALRKADLFDDKGLLNRRSARVDWVI